MKPVVFSIIGIGGYAKAYLGCLDRLEKKGVARLSSAVVRNATKYSDEVTLLKKRGVRIYKDWKKMLEDQRGKTDIVAIPTSIQYHKDMAIRAMESGYNVIVEKPPAAVIQDVDAMIDTSRRTGKFCAVGFQFMSDPSIIGLKEKICKGGLGIIQEVVCKGKWKRSNSYYERNSWAGKIINNGKVILDGSMSNPLSHYLNNSLYLASNDERRAADPLKVRAELYKGHDIDGEDTCCLEAVLKGGAKIFFFSTLCSREQEPASIEVVGTKGRAIWKQGAGTGNNTDNFFMNAIEYLKGKANQLNCPIELARAFTLLVNGAYESAQKIKRIPKKYIMIENEKESVSTYITDIEKIIEEGSTKRILFSELGVKWAYVSNYFLLKGFERFVKK